MDNTSLNVNYLTRLMSNGLSNGKGNSQVEVEKQLAVIAFQKIYEMMLQGDSSSSASLMSTLFLSQINEEYDVNLQSALDISSSLNMNTRLHLKKEINTNEVNGNYLNTSSLGDLSAKYESNGRPGVIANNPGDYGGKSCGHGSFPLKQVLCNLLLILKRCHYEYYNILVQANSSDGIATEVIS